MRRYVGQNGKRLKNYPRIRVGDRVFASEEEEGNH